MFKSMKHTWQLFNLEDGNPLGVHLSMIITPFALAIGVALVLSNFINILISVIFGIVTFFTVAYIMGWNNDKENELIERRLATANQCLTYPGQVPHQYFGPKRWIALGKINPDNFLEAVMERDPELRKMPYSEMRKSVEYVYMADTFSPRNQSPAIKYVHSSFPGAYPVTHLKAPYDYFVEQKEGLEDES